MSSISKLFRHSSNYFTGQVLLMAAGLASFPLYTRLLSVKEYGLFALINTTIMLIVALSKLGLQHSVVRFYSDYASDSGIENDSKFYSTFYFSILVVAALSSVLLFSTMQVVSNSLIDENLKRLLAIASILVLFNCSLQTFSQYFRAEQKPKYYMMLGVSLRYGSLIFSIFFFFYFGRDLYSMLMGSIIFEAILFGVVSYVFLKKRPIRLRSFSVPLLRQSLKYGLPLIGVELSHLALNFGDRYLIQYFLGPVAVGIYSAGHGMATYGAELFTLPVRDAVFPIYMDIYNQKGEEETKIFLGKALRYFLLLALPIILGFTAISSDLIVLLASKKYAESCVVVPYVLGGLMIYGTWSFFGAGLFVQKKTLTVMRLIIMTSIVNVALNLFLIPRFQIMGAAIATFISFTFYISLLIGYSFRSLSFKIDYGHISAYMVASIIMYVIISRIEASNLVFNLGSKIVSGAMIYSVLILVLDGDVRRKVKEILGEYFTGENIKGWHEKE